MSLRTNALVALGSRYAGVDWLLDELARDLPGFREAAARWADYSYSKFWQREDGGPAGPNLVGPGTFSLYISPSAIEVHHILRFERFTGIAEERDFLRRACYELAKLVGSSRALYLHELLPTGFHDGLDLPAIEADLHHRFGAPSPTWEQLHAADEYGPGCWYVDEFADFTAAKTALP